MSRKKQPKRKSRRSYDDDFKAESVQMLLDGHSAQSVVDRLGISGTNLLYRWKRRRGSDQIVVRTDTLNQLFQPLVGRFDKLQFTVGRSYEVGQVLVRRKEAIFDNGRNGYLEINSPEEFLISLHIALVFALRIRRCGGQSNDDRIVQRSSQKLNRYSHQRT